MSNLQQNSSNHVILESTHGSTSPAVTATINKMYYLLYIQEFLKALDKQMALFLLLLLFQVLCIRPSNDISGELEFEEYVSQNSCKLQENKSIQCLLCNKITLHVGNMKQHFEVHHYHRSYKCEVCLKNFKTKNCLAVHKKNHGHNS